MGDPSRARQAASLPCGLPPIVQALATSLLILHVASFGASPGAGETVVSSHRRNPPQKALALSPARQCGGSVSSFFTLPPPSTVSPGSSAVISRATTSAT